jgi:hypothetical protein
MATRGCEIFAQPIIRTTKWQHIYLKFEEIIKEYRDGWKNKAKAD